MSLNFVKVPSPVMEFAALEHLKNDGYCCDDSSAFIFDRIFFILSGKNVNYKSLDGFDIQPDQTLDLGVSCP